MMQPSASQPDPQAGLPPEPIPTRQPSYVRMPSLPPTVTYVLIGLTVFIYILQMLGSALLGDSN